MIMHWKRETKEIYIYTHIYTHSSWGLELSRMLLSLGFVTLLPFFLEPKDYLFWVFKSCWWLKNVTRVLDNLSIISNYKVKVMDKCLKFDKDNCSCRSTIVLG